MRQDILVIIPARGGSKGIPRKNLRALNDKPLISYAIQTALNSSFHTDVYVTSDDDEILHTAKKLHAKIHKRPASLAQDKTTLDPVIFQAYKDIKSLNNKKYELIITLQPTSPLLKTSTLDQAIRYALEHPKIDTIISCINDTHLTWQKKDNVFVPNYTKRVNRQQLPPTYKETGGFLITRNSIISSDTRIGKNIHLIELPPDEAIDIDSYEDWNLCEYYLKRKKIVFVLKGYPEVGLGHVYNCLIIASQILNHRLIFLVDKKSDLAYKKISESNYEVYQQKSNDLREDIFALKPDIIINDILDTTKEYIKSLKSKNICVINFEDLGMGAQEADVVFNAIYPEKKQLLNHYYGPSFFCARDEFLLTPSKKIEKNVKNIMITFGGTDPNNLTEKVLDAIYNYCIEKNININVVTGFGYTNYKSLNPYKKAKILKNISNISDYIYNADIIFTSAGRTTYEIALIGTPAIILAQNQRELTHFFANETHGFVNLGLGEKASRKEILDHCISLIDNSTKRMNMNKEMLKNNIRSGRKKVIEVIKQTIEKC